MSLETRISDLAAAIGADIKSLYAAIGSAGGSGSTTTITATDVQGAYTCTIGDAACYRLTLSGDTTITLPASGGRIEFLVTRPPGQFYTLAIPDALWVVPQAPRYCQHVYMRAVYFGGAWIITSAVPIGLEPRVEMMVRAASGSLGHSYFMPDTLPSGTILLAIVHANTTSTIPGWTELGQGPVSDPSAKSRAYWRAYTHDIGKVGVSAGAYGGMFDGTVMLAISGVQPPVVAAGVTVDVNGTATHTHDQAGVAVHWIADRDNLVPSLTISPTMTLLDEVYQTGHYGVRVHVSIVADGTPVTAKDNGGSYASAWWRVLLPLA